MILIKLKEILKNTKMNIKRDWANILENLVKMRDLLENQVMFTKNLKFYLVQKHMDWEIYLIEKYLIEITNL